MGNQSAGLGQRIRSVVGAGSWPRRANAQLSEHATRLRAHDDRVAELQTALESQAAAFAKLHDHVHLLTSVVDANSIWSQIQRGTEWAASAPLETTPTVSIVLPTRDRSILLTRALDSVHAQSYPHWELVIVDDGSTDDTADIVASAANADERIRVVSSTGIGGAGARNAGLDVVTGDIVTFLDDDNTMTPHWLRAVADFMGRHSECDAIYGAQLRLPITPGSTGGAEVLFVPHFDLDAYLIDNSVDLGMIAVRAGHPQLRFDPELRALQDWEMFARVAATTTITPLPALASCYSAAAPGRITDRHGGETAVGAMRERLRDTVAELQLG